MGEEGTQAPEVRHEDINRAATLIDSTYRKDLARIIARASLHGVVAGLLRKLAYGQEAVLPLCGRFQARMAQAAEQPVILTLNRFDELGGSDAGRSPAEQEIYPSVCHYEEVVDIFTGLVEETYGFFALTPLIAQNGKYLDRRNGRDTLLAQISRHWAGEITRHSLTLCQVFLAGLMAACTFVELRGIGLFTRTSPSAASLDFAADKVALRYLCRFSCQKEG